MSFFCMFIFSSIVMDSSIIPSNDHIPCIPNFFTLEKVSKPLVPITRGKNTPKVSPLLTSLPEVIINFQIDLIMLLIIDLIPSPKDLLLDPCTTPYPPWGRPASLRSLSLITK